MTIVVLGANGQVGTHLRTALPSAVFWDRSAADLLHPDHVEAALRDQAPSIIVNCAAYTAVDKAELEPALAWLVNAESAAAIARAARTAGADLVHLSTDYVFDGCSDRPYNENDGTHPINVYGRTKLAGELATATLCQRSWILRTSWVFSEHGANFVKTMLRLAAAHEQIRVVADQLGRPSYAGDVANLIAALVARLGDNPPQPGLYHLGGGEPTSWFEFARTLFHEARQAGLIDEPPKVEPISTADYPTQAQRPMNSVLEPNTSFLEALGASLDWKAGLKAMMRKI
ncbi:MAG: dTDP-4-dehydrorhamnose reductase [Pseudomonadales bacterium]